MSKGKIPHGMGAIKVAPKSPRNNPTAGWKGHKQARSVYRAITSQLVKNQLVVVRKESSIHRRVLRQLLAQRQVRVVLDNNPRYKTKGTVYIRMAKPIFNMNMPKEYRPAKPVRGAQFNAGLADLI